MPKCHARFPLHQSLSFTQLTYVPCSSSANPQAPIPHPSLHQLPCTHPWNDSHPHQPPHHNRAQQLPQLQILGINSLYQNPPIRLWYTECIMDSLLYTLIHQQRVNFICQAIRNRHSVLWCYRIDCNSEWSRDEGDVD